MLLAFVIYFCRGHWFLLIFCHFGESLGSELRTPCILLLDSLAKADHSKRLEPAIRKFVLDIYGYFERTEDKSLVCKMPFLVPKVPQQRDNAECGFLVLYYIKLFVESAPESFSITDGYPYFVSSLYHIDTFVLGVIYQDIIPLFFDISKSTKQYFNMFVDEERLV
ncbi:putative Ulp1 peptidase [Helianthus debilis subsp. tardiflorus]